MAFKLCAKCGQQVREIDDHCWNCKSDKFRPTGTAGTPATAATLNRPTPAQQAEAEPAKQVSFWERAQAEAQRRVDDDKWGEVNPALVCPHCQTKGKVRALLTKRKKGISGAKATGAVLTLGWSILATGLSRKEYATQAHCDSCNSTWDF